jgi:protein-S-isoprenylcysteine O-methyltransferase Ste14
VAQWSDSAWRIAAGLPLLLAGAVLNVWADQLFKRAGTTVKPFEPSTALIVTGPFALTRHPMYLGMALALAGVALALGSATPWAVLPVFAWLITRRFIIPEERKMEATFGARYLEYAVKVRRWL